MSSREPRGRKGAPIQIYTRSSLKVNREFEQPCSSLALTGRSPFSNTFIMALLEASTSAVNP